MFRFLAVGLFGIAGMMVEVADDEIDMIAAAGYRVETVAMSVEIVLAAAWVICFAGFVAWKTAAVLVAAWVI